MKERIILAPGLNGNELIKNLAIHDICCFNTRIVSAAELARIALMRSGITLTETYIDSRDEVALIAKAVKDVPYFKTTSYSDVRNLASAVRRMRFLVSSPDEAVVLRNTLLNEDVFIKKNEALIIVYERYIQYLKENNLVDSVMLIRKAITDGSVIDAEVVVLEEFTLSPLEAALAQKITDGTIKRLSIRDIYKASETSIKISGFKNCYGASNEVETILEDIYSGRKLDECTVAVTDPSTYSQIFFDYALIHNIPMTFGCGVPIINSNPAKLLSLYFQWVSDFFSSDALKKMIFSKAFNRNKLISMLPEQDEEFRWSSFYRYLGDIGFTNDKELNHEKLEAFSVAATDEGRYITEGESKEYKEYKRKIDCIPLLEIMADILGEGREFFIQEYAVIRTDDSKISTKMLTALDVAASHVIFDELVYISESGTAQTDADAITNILKTSVMSQQSEPGYLHITGIDRAFSSVRKNLYLAGFSASKFPGSPTENYLLLDSDLTLFGEDAYYLRSKERIERKKENALCLAELASALGSDVHVSYSGMNTADIKKDNASSLIYELYSRRSGTNASFDELEKEITKVGYFDPAISSSRLVGKAYVEGGSIIHKKKKENVYYDWNIDSSYSPTALETFFSCPRRFMLRYVLGIPEPDDEDPFEVIDSKAVGTMAHSLMEQLADSDMTQDAFLELAGEFFDRYIALHPPMVPEKVEDEKAEFLDMMETAYKGDPHRKVVLAEEDIYCTHSTGVNIHGLPDRVEQLDDGTCLIVDFKTGYKIKHKQDDFATCFQVIVYAYLMESMGYKVSGAEFRYIRLGEIVKCKYDDEMKSKLEFALQQFKKMMEDGEFKCCNSLDDSCTYCKFLWVCSKGEEVDFWSGLNFGYDEDDDLEGGSDDE